MKYTSLFWLPIFLVFTTNCDKEPTTKAGLLSNMDTLANPANDFYRYANGGWIDSHPIPGDESSYDVSGELQRTVDQQISDIINDLTKHKHKKGSVEDDIVKFFLSGMDTARTYSEGLAPLQFMFDTIDNIKSISDLQNGIAILQKYCVNAPLDFECGPNPNNTNFLICKIYDFGMALYDRTYYLNDDYSEIIETYRKHIEKMLSLYGLDSVTAQKSANAIYNIEYEIAKITPKVISSLNPTMKTEMTLEDLLAIAPNIDWEKIFSQIDCPRPKRIILYCGQEYMSGINTLLETIPINDWKIYFKYMILDSFSRYTSKAFSDENHDFFHKYLCGEDEHTQLIDNVITDITNYLYEEPIGKLYVDKYYSEQTTNAIATMTDNIKEAMEEHIMAATWISSTTREYAIKKLKAMQFKIGHTKNWTKDFGSFISDSYVSNIINTYKYYGKTERSYIDKPLDKSLWILPPQNVNAIYIRDLNSIEIYAAQLQPPYYYRNGDDAVNYGAIGYIIAHEITHGFDNLGKYYGTDGSTHNWWNTTDSLKFAERAQTLIDRFNSFIVIDTMHADGEYTLDENIADLGGLEIAYTAFTKTKQWEDQTKLIDGLTPDQRFFISYAQSMAGTYRDEAIINYTITDNHALNQYRVEGPLPSMDAFIKAFDIKPGDRYYLPDSLRTRIW